VQPFLHYYNVLRVASNYQSIGVLSGHFFQIPRAPLIYPPWHGLFLNALGKYALTDHVFLNVTPTDAAN
jgi:hypothetical protein